MRARTVVLAVAIVLAPLGARAADLVVWWQKGYYEQEDDAIQETVAAFEQKTGKQVELDLLPQNDIPGKIEAALEAGQPPDFAFALRLRHYFVQWAVDDRLVDLTDTVGSFSNLFDPDTLGRGRVRNPATGQKAVYGLPIGRSTNYLHVWKSLLEQAGFSLGEIPKEWERSGRSGAIGSNPQCARPWAATTSGGSPSTCPVSLARPTYSSSNSWMPTGRTT